MAKKKRSAARPDPWETGELGNDERYVRRASATEEARIEAALGLRMISIRLPERLIEQLKLIAVHRGIGYQPMMRDVLSRFARGELIHVLRQQTEIAELEGRKAAASKSKTSRLRKAA